MKHLGLIGRILICLPLVGFGMGHMANAGQMTSMVPAYLPFPIFWVYLTGLALLASAVSIIINKKMKMATLLLGIMLILFAMLIWLPKMMMGADEMEKMMGMSNFLKDLGIAGGALYLSSTSED